MPVKGHVSHKYTVQHLLSSQQIILIVVPPRQKHFRDKTTYQFDRVMYYYLRRTDMDISWTIFEQLHLELLIKVAEEASRTFIPV